MTKKNDRKSKSGEAPAARKLTLQRETVKDLDVKRQKATGVRGGNYPVSKYGTSIGG
jgi:hypothetical protein